MPTSETSRRGFDGALAHLLLRLTLGTNILMHGGMRILTGENKFVTGLVQTYQGSLLPQSLVWGFATVLPWIEAAIGIMIVTGFRLRIALAAGAVWMTVLTFGVGVRQNWESAGLQLPYAIAFALLLASVSVDRYSLDGWLRRNK